MRKFISLVLTCSMLIVAVPKTAFGEMYLCLRGNFKENGLTKNQTYKFADFTNPERQKNFLDIVWGKEISHGRMAAVFCKRQHGLGDRASGNEVSIIRKKDYKASYSGGGRDEKGHISYGLGEAYAASKEFNKLSSKEKTEWLSFSGKKIEPAQTYLVCKGENTNKVDPQPFFIPSYSTAGKLITKSNDACSNRSKVLSFAESTPCQGNATTNVGGCYIGSYAGNLFDVLDEVNLTLPKITEKRWKLIQERAQKEYYTKYSNPIPQDKFKYSGLIYIINAKNKQLAATAKVWLDRTVANSLEKVAA